MQEIFNRFNSLSDACRYYGYKINGNGLRKISNLITEHNIDVSHFNKTNKLKYNREIKNCPICGKEFITIIDGPRKPKITCSHSCANSYFRSGLNNPNTKKIKDNEIKHTAKYRTICFHYHEKKCIICDEKNIVSVHHYDENHKNNNPDNLIPLCPTHHQYVHSRFKHLVIDKINQYILEFRNKLYLKTDCV